MLYTYKSTGHCSLQMWTLSQKGYVSCLRFHSQCPYQEFELRSNYKVPFSIMQWKKLYYGPHLSLPNSLQLSKPNSFDISAKQLKINFIPFKLN